MQQGHLVEGTAMGIEALFCDNKKKLLKFLNSGGETEDRTDN